MFHARKCQISEYDAQMFESHPNSISQSQFIVYCINVLMGMGFLKMGKSFKSGIILALIIDLVFALLGYYVFFLYLKCAAYTRQSAIEEIWSNIYGRKFLFIPALFAIFTAELFFVNYCQIISKSVADILCFLFPNAPPYITNRYFIMLFGCIFFFVPFCATQNLKFLVTVSVIELCGFFIIIIHAVYIFKESVSKYGFDPNHKLTLWAFDKNIIKNISLLILAYLLLPMNYPGLRHLNHASQKCWMRVVGITFSYSFIASSIFGLFTYLTFFDLSIGGSVIDQYENNYLTLGIRVIVVLSIVCSTPLFFNQVRYIMVNMYSQNDIIQPGIWFISGLVAVFLGILISGLSEPYRTVVVFLQDMSSSIVMFVLSPLMFIKALGKAHKMHLFGSLFLIVVGFVAVGLSAYLNFFDTEGGY